MCIQRRPSHICSHKRHAVCVFAGRGREGLWLELLRQVEELLDRALAVIAQRRLLVEQRLRPVGEAQGGRDGAAGEGRGGRGLHGGAVLSVVVVGAGALPCRPG